MPYLGMTSMLSIIPKFPLSKAVTDASIRELSMCHTSDEDVDKVFSIFDVSVVKVVLCSKEK